MASTETRRVPYQQVLRAVIAHHKANGELVDFRLIPGGAILHAYRVRTNDAETWNDLLPTGVSGPRYRSVIQGLAPILFPAEELTIVAVGRVGDELTTEVERAAAAVAEAETPERLPY